MATKKQLQRQLIALEQKQQIIEQKWISSTSTAADPSTQLLYAFGGGYASNSGQVVTPYMSLQSSAVYACINIISSDVAKIQLRLTKEYKGGWKDVPDHLIMKLLNRPNKWMTPFDFWSFVVLSHQLRGNAYIYIRRINGQPEELVPLVPDNVSIQVTDSGELFYQFTHQLMYGGNIITAEDKDIIHIKNMTLNGGIYGLSPITCSQDVIGIALATQKHAATVFRNGALLSGVLMHPGRINIDKAKQLAQQFRDAYTGSENAHKTAVLEEGMKYERIQMSAVDAQLLESRKFSIEEICRIFRVPPHKLASLDRATFSNIENQNQQYIDDCLMSICRRIEEALEFKLLDPQSRKFKLRFDFDLLLRGDLKSRMEAYQIALMNGIYSRNEVRERENMEPVEGGDVFSLPLNQGTIGQGENDDTTPGPSTPNQIPQD